MKLICPKCYTINDLDASQCIKRNCVIPFPIIKKDGKVCPRCGWHSKLTDIRCNSCTIGYPVPFPEREDLADFFKEVQTIHNKTATRVSALLVINNVKRIVDGNFHPRGSNQKYQIASRIAYQRAFGIAKGIIGVWIIKEAKSKNYFILNCISGSLHLTNITLTKKILKEIKNYYPKLVGDLF